MIYYGKTEGRGIYYSIGNIINKNIQLSVAEYVIMYLFSSVKIGILFKNVITNFFFFFFFFFFDLGFTALSRIFSLISSRSFIEGGRKPEYPEKNHLTIRKQNLAFPHMTRARLEPQR